MASVRATMVGVEVGLSDAEIKNVINIINVSTSVAQIAAALGLVAPHSVAAHVIAGLCRIGSGVLTRCSSPGRGVDITIYWIAVPWCNTK